MPTYANAGNQENILNDTTGGAALTGTDIVNILQGDVNHSATLDALGTTPFAEFNTGAGYAGNLGDGASGLLVNAAIIRLADSGRKHAITCSPAHTVDELEWKNRRGGELTLETIEEVTLVKLLASGRVVAMSSAKLVTVHVAAAGLSAFFRENDASPVDPIAALLVGSGGAQGTAYAYADRRVTAATVNAGGEFVARKSCAPALTINGGTYRHESDAALSAITAGPGSRIDFSRAMGDSSSIAWTITGDITIVEPPAGVTIDMPTTGEANGFRVRYEPAA